MTIGVIDGSSEQRDRCIQALVLAFVRDPVMCWLYPEPSDYLAHFPGFARAFGGPAFGSEAAWLSDDAGGSALWLPNGVQPDRDAIERHLLETVDAAHQGKGLGAQLLQAALGRCDAEGLPAYLESSNPANISLYERHGFRVTAEIRVGDAPPVFPMLRPGR